MTSGILRRGLRALAIAIAVLAWLDPSFAIEGRLRVAVIATPDASADQMAAVTGRLAAVHDVVRIHDPDVDAWVVVTGPDLRLPRLPASIPVSVVVPPQPQEHVDVEALVAPDRVHASSRPRIVVRLRARGMAGRTSAIVVRQGALELARNTHRWSAQDERAEVTFEPLLPLRGVNHLTVAVLDDERPAASADAVIVMDEERLPLMVIEGRPSWNSTFVRRALESDPRFEVAAVTRVARGVQRTIGVPGMPALSRSLLQRHRALIVGAPEALTREEVQLIEWFARERGGSVVLLPDTVTHGPWRALVPAGRLELRLLDSPAAVTLDGGMTLLASELAIPDGIHPGAYPIARNGSASPLIVSPAGAGEIVFAGLLDAWRFRNRRDHPFDAAWTLFLQVRASRAAEPLTLELPRIAEPGERLQATLVVRPDVTGSGPLRVKAHLTGPADSSSTTRVPVRFVPGEVPRELVATVDVPDMFGAYALHVATEMSDGTPLTASAPVVVADRARGPAPDREILRTTVEAGGGVMVESAQLERLQTHLARLVPASREPARRHPMRSPWWLLPLAGCLGGEWYLRRRHGLR
ncbi:MAG TPA: hypothetical protein VIL35_03635 [Vicinamibacterales bacterium]